MSRLGHYGQLTRDLIEKAKTYEEGEEKAALVVTIGNLMKRHFLTWNKSTVENSLIREQIKEMSEGALTLPEDAELVSSAEILKSKRKTSDALDRHRGKKRKR
jgi:predicted nuclease of restriction endonuclease-like RecB superfamily